MKTISTTMDGYAFKKEPLEEDYEIGDDIGSGHFAVVRRVTHKKTGHAYAAKFIRKRRGGGRKGARMEDIHKEVNILRQLNHNNVISLYDVYETSLEVILILELVTGGELFDYISEKDHLGEEEASAFIAQILHGLKHLHDKNIAHLDLKPENIMLLNRNSQKIKLIDFGLAQRLTEKEDIRALMGTAEFVAPEVVSYESLSLATDMWSIGVITYILLSGASPFLGDSQQETYHNITAINFQFDQEYFAHTSELAKDFIRKLFVKNPRKRATVDDCLNHPWIRPKAQNEALERRSAVINIDNLKAFIARKRWKQSMRVVSLCNRLSKSMLLRKSSDTLGSRNTLDEEKSSALNTLSEEQGENKQTAETVQTNPDDTESQSQACVSAENTGTQKSMEEGNIINANSDKQNSVNNETDAKSSPDVIKTDVVSGGQTESSEIYSADHSNLNMDSQKAVTSDPAHEAVLNEENKKEDSRLSRNPGLSHLPVDSIQNESFSGDEITSREQRYQSESNKSSGVVSFDRPQTDLKTEELKEDSTMDTGGKQIHLSQEEQQVADATDHIESHPVPGECVAEGSTVLDQLSRDMKQSTASLDNRERNLSNQKDRSEEISLSGGGMSPISDTPKISHNTDLDLKNSKCVPDTQKKKSMNKPPLPAKPTLPTKPLIPAKPPNLGSLSPFVSRKPNHITSLQPENSKCEDDKKSKTQSINKPAVPAKPSHLLAKRGIEKPESKSPKL